MGDSPAKDRRFAPSVLAVALAGVLVAMATGALGAPIPGAWAEDAGPGAGQSDGAPTDTAPAGTAPADTTGGSPANEVAGGSLPGSRPRPGPGDGPSTADPAPALSAGFVDDDPRLWKQVQRGQQKVAALGGSLKAANRSLLGSWGDLSATIRERGKAEVSLADAAGQFSLSVRDLYITGSTDVDVMLSVLGSQPDDVLRNIDAIVYLRSATGNETLDYEAAQQYATIVESAHAAAEIRADGDRSHVARVRAELAKAKRSLRIDQDDLQKLVSIAAPQTVVGKDGCPKAVLDGTLPEGVNVRELCKLAVKTAVTAQAAIAVKYALLRLGAPYACEGIGRLDAWRYDCSSYVSRAYSEGAGLGTAGDGWAPSTRDMVPWDGAQLDPHYSPISGSKLRPGDLVLYDTCPVGETCPYRHVVMYLGPAEKGGLPLMAHTNGCGMVAHVEPFWGTDVANYLGSRRVMALPGERLNGATPRPPRESRPARG